MSYFVHLVLSVMLLLKCNTRRSSSACDATLIQFTLIAIGIFLSFLFTVLFSGRAALVLFRDSFCWCLTVDLSRISAFRDFYFRWCRWSCWILIRVDDESRLLWNSPTRSPSWLVFARSKHVFLILINWSEMFFGGRTGLHALTGPS